MKPSVLLPGDFLLYRNHGTLGNLISWGEWTGKPKEALEYSHVGIVLDDFFSAEMNPPAARRFPLAEVPWDRVDVFRIQIGDVTPYANLNLATALHKITMRRLGEKYAFGFIGQSLGLGLLARIGLGGASRWIMSKANMAPGRQRDICSTWAEEVVTQPIQEFIEPKFDLFPDLGENQARPADFPLSPLLFKVEV